MKKEYLKPTLVTLPMNSKQLLDGSPKFNDTNNTGEADFYEENATGEAM